MFKKFLFLILFITTFSFASQASAKNLTTNTASCKKDNYITAKIKFGGIKKGKSLLVKTISYKIDAEAVFGRGDKSTVVITQKNKKTKKLKTVWNSGDSMENEANWNFSRLKKREMFLLPLNQLLTVGFSADRKVSDDAFCKRTTKFKILKR